MDSEEEDVISQISLLSFMLQWKALFWKKSETDVFMII